MCSQINTIFSTTFRFWHKPEDTPIHQASALLLVFFLLLLLLLLLLFTSNVIFIGVHCENWLRYTSCTCFCLPFACTTWRMRILAPAFKIKCALCVCVCPVCAHACLCYFACVCMCVCEESIAAYSLHRPTKKTDCLVQLLLCAFIVRLLSAIVGIDFELPPCVLYRVVSLAYK